MDRTTRNFIDAIATAAFQLRAGDPFAAGSAYEEARRLSWQIHSSELHERAQILCNALVAAYLTNRPNNR